MTDSPTATTPGEPAPVPARRGHPAPVAEIFLAFLRLGLTSFGGPIAHIGYFHDEFVLRRRWLDEVAFADLVALCQLLPGPASSQVGISIGLFKAGYRGALAAWTAFTLPSALLMVAFAYGSSALTGSGAAAVMHGLRLVAVAIVAQAVWQMARSLSRGLARAAITVAAALIVLLIHSTAAQLAAIAMGAAFGWLLSSRTAALPSPLALKVPVSKRAGATAVAAFLILLLGPALLSAAVSSPALALFNAFYRSGALVFGGGHVVLPLLRQAFVTPGWVTDDMFLAGYGAAQTLPGPLFSFGAYLGAVVRPSPHGLAGAALGLLSLFLPGVLILIGALPYWDSLRRYAGARAMMSGVNAAVVGLLAAALYQPLWITSIMTPADVGVVVAGFMMLTVWRMPPLVVVAAVTAGTFGLWRLTGIA